MKHKNNNKRASGNGINRRNFFKFMGVSGAMVAGINSKAEGTTLKKPAGRKRAMGVLVDTTWCGGCRSCEIACNEANKLPVPDRPFDDEEVLNTLRDTSPTAFTVVNRYLAGPDKEEFTRKRQCMHCLEPACSSACIIKAMVKQPEGPVSYREDLCIGCRYCMVACPFEIPKFEYHKTMPLIRKCQFCLERQKEGKEPACVSECPSGALKFGSRDELIEDAKSRIYKNPDDYVHHIYGEHEVGGTSWMYLSAVPFEELGLPKYDKKPYPEYTSGAMSVVPMVVLLWPLLLMGFHKCTHGEDDSGHGESVIVQQEKGGQEK